MHEDEEENFLSNSNKYEYKMIRDWRKTFKTKPSYYRRTYRINFQILFLIMCIVVTIIIFFYLLKSSTNPLIDSNNSFQTNFNVNYNHTYPLTMPITNNGITTYQIAIIADMDKDSHDQTNENKWKSYLKKGSLSYNIGKNSIAVTFDENRIIEIDGSYSLKGRGMELSELVIFNGKLLTFDDRTGIVYELKDGKAYPWVILMDGDGISQKGFKSEWATVKDEILFVGSMGKEWTTSSGEFESFDPMYVKAITVTGEVRNFSQLEV